MKESAINKKRQEQNKKQLSCILLRDAGNKYPDVKNMNSIRNVQRAIEFEITRQIEVLESGGKLSQETRGFDALKGITISMRSKEAANDYRYFPEPDLQPLFIKQEQIDLINILY